MDILGDLLRQALPASVNDRLGKTRTETEADLLACACLEREVRDRVVLLPPGTFRLGRHRAIFDALCAATGRPDDVWMSRALGIPEAEFTGWRLAQSPTTPYDDIEALRGMR